MKPSAYISDGGILFKESPPDSILKLSPLYTSAEIQALHNLVKEQPIVKEQPMRELTDKEILEVANQIEPLNGSTMEQAFIYFARAILKKAGEK
jgi:hypothetical protein